MKKNSRKGFTITEMLIALLIISLVLAAALPTLTKRNASSEKAWKTDDKGNIFASSLLSRNTAGIAGYTSHNIKDNFKDTSVSDAIGSSALSKFRHMLVNPENTKFIFFQRFDGEAEPFNKSHLSFYTLKEDETSALIPKPTVIVNAGRFTADETNMGFGILSLANAKPGDREGKFNTAYGQYSSLVAHPYYNIAIGYGALKGRVDKSGYDEKNDYSYYNMAIGNWALENVSYDKDVDNPEEESRFSTILPPSVSGARERGFLNTAIGHGALRGRSYDGTDWHEQINNGQRNTAVGHDSMVGNRLGSYNTALGFWSLAAGPNDGHYNTAIGYHTLSRNQAGNHNTAVGAYALPNNTTGVWNIAVGAKALNSAVESSEQIAIGYRAMEMATTVNPTSGTRQNIAIGTAALRNATGTGTGDTQTSFHNIAIGGHALNSLQIGSHNIAIGNLALGDTTFGNPASPTGMSNYSNNIAIGSSALHSNTTGSRNIAIGFQALQSNTDGSTSIAIGNNAMHEAKKAISFPTFENIGIGASALKKVTAPYNVAMGDNALVNLTDGQYNVAIGYNVFGAGGPSNSYATYKFSNNTAIGAGAGEKMTGGTGNILIGRNVGPTSGTPDYRLYIGYDTGDNPLIYGTKINNTADATLTFNTKTTETKKDLKVGGNLAVSGDLTVSGTITGTLSDARLKNIKGDSTAGLNEINKIQVKNFTFKKDKEKRPRVGVIAQQLQKVFPNSVMKGEDGYLTISKDEMFYAMLNAIKELGAKIQEIFAKIAGLDKRLTELEKQNKLLKQENEKIKKQNNDIIKRLEKLEKAQNK